MGNHNVKAEEVGGETGGNDLCAIKIQKLMKEVGVGLGENDLCNLNECRHHS